jgi:dihydroneopterin aldolase
MTTEPSRNHYRILVRDLLLMCSIGIHAHEKLAPQRVRINLDMAVLESVTPADDDIANVVSYEDVIDGIKALVASGHVNLVETLAEQVAALCLKDHRVEQVVVRVEKLDVYTEAASVGIEIERRRRRD